MGDVVFAAIQTKYCKDHGLNSVRESSEKFGQFIKENLILPSGVKTFGEFYEDLAGEGFSLGPYLDSALK